MNDIVDYYCNLFGCEDEDSLNEFEIKKNIFFSRLRASTYYKILKQQSGLNQWLHIVGKKSKDSMGQRISLSKESQKILNNIVDYYQSDEGKEELFELGIKEPEHFDEIVNWISEAMTSKELSNNTFKFALKKFRKEYIGK